MSISIEDKGKRHCIRGNKKCCKIDGCNIRGRYNYGIEYFYHGFCKNHYSQYQEGIIDFHGNVIRPKLYNLKDIKEYKKYNREKGKRWNKEDHVKNQLRCKICGCERSGEVSHGKIRYFKGMCSYHYRDWYLKGFMDENGDLIIKTSENITKSKKKVISNIIISIQMVKKIRKNFNF
jgi:hypothetical protein